MTAPDPGFEPLQAYLDALHRGAPADRAALLARYPDLAGLLDCLDALEQLAPPPEPDPDAGTVVYRPGAAADTGFAVDGPAAAPTRFGPYELEGELGRGGMGVVYRARHVDLGRPVALKMILGNLLASPDHRSRFHDEARAAAGVCHPHIVAVYEAGEVGGQPFFAMQLVAGRSLADRLRHGPLEPDAAARLVRTVAAAVHHLHGHGLVHRDLKPSNILLGANDHPYVTDFGLVKLLTTDSHRTCTGAIVGTPSYMAPEQAAGRAADVGPRSDVYSLGAILYECLTGRPAFQADSPLDVLVQVLESDPPPPRQLRREIPPELELICLRCLEKAPESRFASADALARVLDAHLKGDDPEVRPPGVGYRLRRWVRREPALASRLAMLLVCVGISQLNYHLFHTAALGLHVQVLTILALWGAASVGCQRLMNAARWSEAARLLWAGLDVALFSLVMYVADYLGTPVAIGYPLLVAGAGLWFRGGIVWFTAGLAALSYLALMMEQAARRGAVEQVHTHAIFLAGLTLLAAVTAYQVQRVRALSKYYEHRPLP